MSLTTAQMAALHQRCFTVPRPWSEHEFATLEGNAGVIDIRAGEGFLMGRVIADEAELLTLAVAPEARKKGVGAGLVQAFVAQATKMGAVTAFLEVADDNEAAVALYRALGFAQTGLRKGYYGERDALVMARSLSAQKTD